MTAFLVGYVSPLHVICGLGPGRCAAAKQTQVDEWVGGWVGRGLLNITVPEEPSGACCPAFVLFTISGLQA